MKPCIVALVLWQLAVSSKLHQPDLLHDGVGSADDEDEPLLHPDEMSVSFREAEREVEDDEGEEATGPSEMEGDPVFETTHDGKNSPQLSLFLEGLSLEDQQDFEIQKAEGLREAQEMAARSREAAVKMVEDAIYAEAGEDGVLVVGNFAEQNPCENVGYLHQTFVHVDHNAATFVCRPCHADCDGTCYGPDGHDCEEIAKKRKRVKNRVPVTLFQDSSFKHFRQSFEESFQMLRNASLSVNDTNYTDDTIPDEMVECMETGECSMESTNITEADGDLEFENSSAELFAMTPDPEAATVDVRTLHSGVQNAIDAELSRRGLIPVREDIDENHSYEVPMTDSEKEDGPIRGEPADQLAGSLLQMMANATEEDVDVNIIETQEESCAQLNRSNRSGGVTLLQFNAFMRGEYKDVSRLERKKRIKAYAKSIVVSLLGVDNPCAGAIDQLMGAMMQIYDCYETATAFRAPLCDLKAKYVDIRDSLWTIIIVARSVKTFASPFRYLPFVNGFAHKAYKIMDLLERKVTPMHKKVRDLKKSPHGQQHESSSCCMPSFLLDDGARAACKVWPHKGYRCGSCEGGAVCGVFKMCNTFFSMETAIDDFFVKWILPFMGAAFLLVREGNGPLASCGIHSCVPLKKVSDEVYNAIQSSFLSKCPPKAPSINFPNMGIMNKAKHTLEKVKSFFSFLRGVLARQHCVRLPWKSCEWRYYTKRVCFRCPGWGRRRRWSGFRWRSCCMHIRVRYPHCWYYWRSFCFSFQQILKGISGWLREFFGPALSTVKAAINVLLYPVKWIMEGMVDQIMRPLNSLNIELPFSFADMFPQLPDLTDCSAVTRMIQQHR